MTGPFLLINGYIDQPGFPPASENTGFQKGPCQIGIYTYGLLVKSKAWNLQHANSIAFKKCTDNEHPNELGQSWAFKVSRAFCFVLIYIEFQGSAV